MASKKDIERFIRVNNLPIDDVNVYDELTLARTRLYVVEKQRDKLMSNWHELKEFIRLQTVINPSNYQYKKVLGVVQEIDEDSHIKHTKKLQKVYEKAKLFDEILDDCINYGIGDSDTVKTMQDIFEEYMRKEGL